MAGKKKPKTVAQIKDLRESLRKQLRQAAQDEIEAISAAKDAMWDEAEEAGLIPEQPLQDSAMGEKTPEYLAWLKRFKPDEYNQKFTNWKGKK